MLSALRFSRCTAAPLRGAASVCHSGTLAAPMDPPDEATLPPELIRAAQAGDEKAFGQIVRACKHRLLGLAARYTQSTHELDDLGQEIFVHIWKGLPGYRFDAPFSHWLSRVTVNTCYTHLKRRQRRWRLFSEPDQPEQLDRAADPAPAAQAAAMDAMERIRPGLSELRPDDRMVLTMLHLEERSVAEIAALTGWSEGNVKVRALRARQKLREILIRHEQA